MPSGETVAGLGAAFQIGRSALAAYQAAITITGQNIANVGNPDYTRQSGRLASVYSGAATGAVSPGIGVRLASLQRHADAAVESRLRLAWGARSGAELTYQTLNRVEALYNELSEYDLSTQLSVFFKSLAELQTDPLEMASRNLVVSNADAIIRTLQRQRSGLLDQIHDLNTQTEAMTRSANGIVEEIAKLNALVVTTEARAAGGSGALRDRRDALLRQLGELIDIQTREHENGIVNVYVGSEPLVDFDRTRGLTTTTVLENGLERVSVRFADNNGSVILRSGRLAATVATRDVHLTGQLEQIDRLAGALIYEINRVQTGGRGLVGYTSATGTYAARSATAALNTADAALPFPVQNGTFFVHIRDQASGQTITRMVKVDLDGLNNNDTTLTGLAAALNAIPGLSAGLTPDNRLQLNADPGWEFSFSEDTSGVLAALGVGTFFEGHNASTMAVHSAVRANPRLIAASRSGDPGDGSNAGRMAAAGDTASALLGGLSIFDFHGGLISRLAVETRSAAVEHEAADAVYSSLLAQRESLSGVSLDEEAINLTKYERAFQGASRFLNVVNGLTDEVLALVS